jgi:hypothetical protein
MRVILIRSLPEVENYCILVICPICVMRCVFSIGVQHIELHNPVLRAYSCHDVANYIKVVCVVNL